MLKIRVAYHGKLALSHFISRSMDHLPKDFLAIDSALSLHFSSSITIPKLFHICQKATSLAGRKISNSTVEHILAVDNLLFKISSPKGSYDYGISVNVPLSKYGTLLSQRRENFEKKLTEVDSITPIKLNEVAVLESPVKCSPHRSPSISPTKVTKYKHIDGIKNDRSKFAFQEKISALETSKANGLSLLERIKLKERMNSKVDIGQRKKDDYDSYIRTKLPQIYDIIYELASVSSVNGPRASQSFTLSKVISIIKDSTVYATSEPEIQDVINDIEMKLGKERLQLIERNHNKVIRVYNLNREEDLQLLGKDN